MPTKLKGRIDAGKANVNGWLAIPSGFSAEVMAQCGWDSVTVDMQHGVQDYKSMVQCFQAMQAHPVTPLVRVPWNEPGIIGKALDGGAMGIICPMVNTAAEAKALADACLAGAGAGAGNCQLEALVAVMEKAGMGTGIDLWTLEDIADQVVRPIMTTPPVVDRATLTQGFAGVPGSFLHHAFSAAERFGVDARDTVDARHLDRLSAGHRRQDRR